MTGILRGMDHGMGIREARHLKWVQNQAKNTWIAACPLVLSGTQTPFKL